MGVLPNYQNIALVVEMVERYLHVDTSIPPANALTKAAIT